MQVLDYSWGRPSPASIKAAGYVGVMRYLSFDNTGKNITLPEAQALTAEGIMYGCAWEGTANGVLGGNSAGLTDAREALRQAQALGYNGPIYFAVDYDAPESDQGAINAYFAATKSIVGADRNRAYGGYWPISRLFDAGLISGAWQTLAWSGGNKDARCSLYQNGAQALGADVNDVLKDDWAGTVTAPAGPADAVVMVQGLPAHNEPNLSSPWGWYYDNQEHITLLSKVVGELVTTGPYPNTRWWYQTDKGWVSDAYVLTAATPPQIPDYVAPIATVPAAPTPPPPVTAPPSPVVAAPPPPIQPPVSPPPVVAPTVPVPPPAVPVSTVPPPPVTDPYSSSPVSIPVKVITPPPLSPVLSTAQGRILINIGAPALVLLLSNIASQLNLYHTTNVTVGVLVAISVLLANTIRDYVNQNLPTTPKG